MPVIAVINRKGGSGKSTLATHIAAYLAKQGLSVMLGDTDKQQSSRSWLSLRPAHAPTIVPWAIDKKSILRVPTGVTHVVLDTPGGLHGFDLAKVVMFADYVIMPVSSSIFDLSSATQCWAELKSMPRIVQNKCSVTIVGMRTDNTEHVYDLLSAWSTSRGLPYLGSLLKSDKYENALANGLTIFDLPADEMADELAQWQGILRWINPDDPSLAAPPPVPHGIIAHQNSKSPLATPASATPIPSTSTPTPISTSTFAAALPSLSGSPGSASAEIAPVSRHDGISTATDLYDPYTRDMFEDDGANPDSEPATPGTKTPGFTASAVLNSAVPRSVMAATQTRLADKLIRITETDLEPEPIPLASAPRVQIFSVGGTPVRATQVFANGKTAPVEVGITGITPAANPVLPPSKPQALPGFDHPAPTNRVQAIATAIPVATATALPLAPVLAEPIASVTPVIAIPVATAVPINTTTAIPAPTIPVATAVPVTATATAPAAAIPVATAVHVATATPVVARPVATAVPVTTAVPVGTAPSLQRPSHFPPALTTLGKRSFSLQKLWGRRPESTRSNVPQNGGEA